jgi:maltose alpha-D-glucosyltransferase/alpha-amylase
MRIYGHGIRRRTASMLGGDGPRLRMAWSLMLTLPGTPVILYGDELGMGEDLGREGRMAVRLPMPWSGPGEVNVAEQRRDPDSLLRFLSRLVHARREAPELGWGTSTLLENDPPALLAHRCDWNGSTVVTVHNLSGSRVAAELDLGGEVTGVDDLLELREHQVCDGRLSVDLDAYGYLWLRVCRRVAS